MAQRRGRCPVVASETIVRAPVSGSTRITASVSDRPLRFRHYQRPSRFNGYTV